MQSMRRGFDSIRSSLKAHSAKRASGESAPLGGNRLKAFVKGFQSAVNQLASKFKDQELNDVLNPLTDRGVMTEFDPSELDGISPDDITSLDPEVSNRLDQCDHKLTNKTCVRPLTRTCKKMLLECIDTIRDNGQLTDKQWAFVGTLAHFGNPLKDFAQDILDIDHMARTGIDPAIEKPETKKEQAVALFADRELEIEPGHSRDHYQVDTYSDLKALGSAARRSNNPNKMQTYLSVYNEQVAPQLTSELDVAEYLSVKVCYLKLEVGHTIDMHIDKDASGAPKDTGRGTQYAEHYQVDTTFIDIQTGLVGYGLKPVDDNGEEIADASPIVVFRGTANVLDTLAAEEGHGSGMQADLDHRGIGYTAFKHGETDITSWINDKMGQSDDRRVAVMGHSLGGALACRTVCSDLLTDVQGRLDVTTFQAPGIDQATAQNFNPENAGNIVRQVVKKDVVTSAGEGHLSARVFSFETGGGPQDRHLGTPGAKEALNGKESSRVREDSDESFSVSGAVEKIRKKLSALKSRVPI